MPSTNYSCSRFLKSRGIKNTSSAECAFVSDAFVVEVAAVCGCDFDDFDAASPRDYEHHLSLEGIVGL